MKPALLPNIKAVDTSRLNTSLSFGRSSLFILSLILATVSAPLVAADTKGQFSVPKNEYGQPDLSGVWNFSSDTPLERPREFANKAFYNDEDIAKLKARAEAEAAAAAAAESGDSTNRSGVGGYNNFWVESSAQLENRRTSLIIDPPDGRMPPMVKGAVVHRGGLGPDSPGERPVRFRVGGIGKDGPEDRGLSERCLMGFNSGPPFMPSMYNNNVQIVQGKDHVVILTEMIHDARIVPIDGRPHLPETISQWSGDSRGRWEGETLVVETKNFSDKIQSFRSAGIASSMHLTERFTRVGADRVDYQFTVNDPKTFTKPFTVLVPMVRVDGEIYEYACHEGNYGMTNILAGARREEREAAKK